VKRKSNSDYGQHVQALRNRARRLDVKNRRRRGKDRAAAIRDSKEN
jgi:hypothetical protein